MSSNTVLQIEFVGNWSLDQVAPDSVDLSDLPFPTFDAVSSLSKLTTAHVLLKSLAALWNFPSSYQLISRIVKETSCLPSVFLNKTDDSLNNILLSKGIISNVDAKHKLFYVSFDIIYSMVMNKSVFYAPLSISETTNLEDTADSQESEIFTISQAFPQYGQVSSQLSMAPGSFNSINDVTKLALLESIPRAARSFPNSKLDIADRLVLAKTFDYSQVNQSSKTTHHVTLDKNLTKLVAKTKSDVDVDPNSLDLTESILPGQGFVQEFNVNHLCKVPSYYTSMGPLNTSTSSVNLAVVVKKPASTSNSSLLLSEAARLSKNVHLLASNDNDSYNHSKYYYSRSYRGPGSGNYKDASLTNRIGKIPTSRSVTGIVHKSEKLNLNKRKRQDTSLKGFTHRAFHPRLVQAIHDISREDTEDLSNLEMAHNNLQFNVLLNAYREISQETWACYYKVKTTDYEQIGVFEREAKELSERQQCLKDIEQWKIDNAGSASRQNNALIDSMALKALAAPPRLNEVPQLDISQRFTAPSSHKDITRHLPLDMRHDTFIENKEPPVMKKAVRKIVTVSGEHTAPQVMDRIDVVQIPNGNAIGWDNLRKYQATDSSI